MSVGTLQSESARALSLADLVLSTENGTDIIALDRRRSDIAAALVEITLSPSETQHLRSLRHDGRRSELQARRALLRFLVGHRLGVLPEDVSIETGYEGAPSLIGHPLFISASSRGHCVAAAISTEPVGIDVEGLIPLDAIPRALMHPGEIAFVDEQPIADRPKAAALLWAAKEAVWKAATMPLSRDPASFQVVIDNGRVTLAGQGLERLAGKVTWRSDLQSALAVVTMARA